MQKQFVFFDLGNTLVRIKRPLLEACVKKIALEKGKELDSESEIEQAITQFKRAEMAEWNATPAEKINWVKQDYQELNFWRQFYGPVLSRIGHPRPTKNLMNWLATIPADPGSFEFFEDVEETLELLKQQGMILGIISNAFPSAKSVIEKLGLERWFTYIILSYEHDMLPKPHPQIYKHAIKQTKVKPEYTSSILFIDDRPHFVEGATRPGVGMSAFLIDRDCMIPECPGWVDQGGYQKIVDLRQVPAYINSTIYQLPLFAGNTA
jgi:HAD superfamily hydrolase (TIGR01549 family)